MNPLQDWALRARPGDYFEYHTRPFFTFHTNDSFDLARALVKGGRFMSFRRRNPDSWTWVIVRISAETHFRLEGILTRMQRRFPPPKRKHGGGYMRAPRSWRV